MRQKTRGPEVSQCGIKLTHKLKLFSLHISREDLIIETKDRNAITILDFGKRK